MLELLAKQHDDWIRVAYNMTDDMDEAKDLVQEMYLEVIEGTRLIKDITYKDQINRYFVWKLLKSLFVDRMRSKQGRSVNKQAASYWIDMRENSPEKFRSMAKKERRNTDKKGEPTTFLKDVRPPYEGASLFLIPNENYPEIRDISMIRGRISKVHIETCPLMEDIDDRVCEECDFEEQESFELIMDKVSRITSDWSPYDKQLFNLYYIQGQSLRQISKGANIGLSSIHNGVKNIREELKNSLSEDLMDYFNGDYDKI